MGYRSAAFFCWVQGAPFYIGLHRQAVELLPAGDGKSWLDVGCGPGLLARLAHSRGYRVLGLDPDPAMIRLARHNARRDAGCRFTIGDLQQASNRHRADVVSAASLLFVLPDPAAALHQLWRCVRPRGRLLVLETTGLMTPAGAQRISHTVRPGRRLALHLWAHARRGRAVAAQVFESLPTQSAACTPLLGGLVHAWTFAKGAE